jgi:hypothetical protein
MSFCWIDLKIEAQAHLIIYGTLDSSWPSVSVQLTAIKWPAVSCVYIYIKKSKWS